MAPGAPGGLSQVMPSLSWDTCQGCQLADPTLLEEGRMYPDSSLPGHLLLPTSVSSGLRDFQKQVYSSTNFLVQKSFDLRDQSLESLLEALCSLYRLEGHKFS